MKAAPPDFSRRISVYQRGGNSGLGVVTLFSMLGVAAVGVPAYPLLREHTGWLVVLLMLGMIIGMLVGFALLMWADMRWRRFRGLAPRFMQTAQVAINAAGIAVAGLGLVAWRDVLALEGIPDCEFALMVHTRQFEKLMLDAPVEDLTPVLSHYMDQQALQPDPDEARCKAAGIIRCRAVVFHWPLFMAWIWAGYLLSGALGIAMWVATNNAGGARNLLILVVVVPPIVAWLVWAIPFTRLGMFSPCRAHWFELDGAHLHSTDGTWDFDVGQTTVIHRRSKGVSFDLDFLSLRPATGRGIDLLFEGEDARFMLDAICKRKLIVVP